MEKSFLLRMPSDSVHSMILNKFKNMILSIFSIANRDLFSVTVASETEKILSMHVFDADIIKIYFANSNNRR